MKNKFIQLAVLLLIALVNFSCSKAPGKTTAKLKLSGIVNLASGVGSGGAILFGKNTNGGSFGLKLNGAEENLILPNGAWSFYAVMWGDESTLMNGTVVCGKSSVQLNGADVSIPMTLSNAACTDSAFSAGRHYVDNSLNRFAKIFIEECDEVSAVTGFGCSKDNQGSALSYRFVFKSFKKAPDGNIVYQGSNIESECRMVGSTASLSNIYSSGFPVNFPSGNGDVPFIASVEMFLGSTTCTAADPKGVRTITFNQGLGVPAPGGNVIVSNNSCTPDVSTGTPEVKKFRCEKFLGDWNGSSCALPTPLEVVTNFASGSNCSATPAMNVAIKHLVSIPTNSLCSPYLNNSTQIGINPFAGGDGSKFRPYKICSEWQMNQIGDLESPDYSSSNFKLMADLNMNRGDFGDFAVPSCVGAASSLIKGHHNLNPLTKLLNSNCTTAATSVPYNATFNGNGKTISHARINVDSSLSDVGFARALGATGIIKNLNFDNISVEAGTNVGGISGRLLNGSVVSDVSIDDGEVRGEDSSIGSVAGYADVNSKITSVLVSDVDLRGKNKIGGLVGWGAATIEKSKYRGFIEQHDNVVGYKVGGLVGDAVSGSSISTSFSEGVIVSSAQYIGGIAGGNTGPISDSYSAMYIVSNYSMSGSATGGIVGINSHINISNVFSDSILNYAGGNGSYNKDGIIAVGTFPSDPATCLSSYPTTSVSAGVLKGHATLRDGTNFLALPNWKSDVPGSLPRLAWEFATSSRECLLTINKMTVANQQTAGRGGVLNPVVLCESAQLKDLYGHSNVYFRLGEDVNISDWTSSNMITIFEGILDGNGYGVYGLNITSGNIGNDGLFKTNYGVIKNLKVVASSIVKTASGSTGLLAGSNSGTIKDVKFIGSKVEGLDYIGVVAGENSGTIDRVRAGVGLVRGQGNVGGLVGSNEGIVKRSVSRVDLKDLVAYANYENFGGVVGSNTSSGIIDQVSFSGRIETTNNISNGSPSFPVKIGGVAGFNAGSITNSMTENHSNIFVKNYASVGGFVGYNAAGGSIHTSFSLGSVIYSNNNSPIPGGSSFHQLVGSNLGSVNADVFFLANQAGGLIGNAQATSCSAGVAIFTGASFLLQGSAAVDLMINRYMPGNGNSLKTFTSFIPPTVDYTVNYTPSCNTSDTFDFLKSFELNTVGKKSIAQFGSFDEFRDLYDIAYTDMVTPANSTRQEALLEYYKSEMEDRLPTLTPPIWELEYGEPYPRLIQVDRN